MGNTSTDGVLLPLKLESASLGFEFGFLKKKAHIEVDSFGFDFVFRSWEPFDRSRLFSSLSVCFSVSVFIRRKQNFSLLHLVIFPIWV